MAAVTESLGLTAAYKILIATGAGAAALAAIWKIVKWLQGPAAENHEKLDVVSAQISSLTVSVAVLSAKVDILADEYKNVRRELSDIRDVLLGRHGGDD